MHNSYTLVLLGDNFVLKCHFLQNCRQFHCLVAMDTKIEFYSLHFEIKCWLLRHYMHKSYTLVL